MGKFSRPDGLLVLTKRFTAQPCRNVKGRLLKK